MTRLLGLWVASAIACSSHTAQVADKPAGGSAPRVVDAAPAATGPLDQDLPRLAARSVELYQAVGRAFAEAGEQCAVATTKLGELGKQYQDVSVANAKVLHDGRARELKAALAPHDEQLEQAARAIMNSKTLPACAKDPAFTKAFDDLIGAPP